MQFNPLKQPIYFDDIYQLKNYARQNHLLLYVLKNTVYDLTEFALQHPGGYDEIKTYSTQDITKIIYNPQIHKHDPTIIFKLSKFIFGYIQEKKQKNLQKSKSTQSLLQQTRISLLTAADPDYLAVPEDCCIEQVRTIKTHKKMFHSFEQITHFQ